jgi:hypothetical protein
MHDLTGYVVNSEKEYTQALEHLHRSPEDRVRLGANAAEYARRIFGAERAAQKFNAILAGLMKVEKRERLPFSSQRVTTAYMPEGARRFNESLTAYHEMFTASVESGNDADLFQRDAEIMKLSALMRRGGVKNYRRFYGNDPLLCFWSGLGSFAEGDMVEAMNEFIAALNNKFGHWRLWWYLAQVARRLGNIELMHASVGQVEQLAPHFEGLESLRRMANGQGAIS